MPRLRVPSPATLLPLSWTRPTTSSIRSFASSASSATTSPASTSPDPPATPPSTSSRASEDPLELPDPDKIASADKASFAETSRKIGKVHRPARPGPVPTGPTLRKRSGLLSPSLPQTQLLELLGQTPGIRHRPTLINEGAARDLVRAWGVDKMQDVTVVDAYAGAGGLTRAFLELPNVKRVVAIEDAFRYQPCLLALKEQEDAKTPGRLILTEQDSFMWESYAEAAKHFTDVPKLPWSELNDKLFLSAQLPNSRHGEQLFVQLVMAIAHRMWYFTRGRFTMGFLGSEGYWKKIFAQPGEMAHHKLAVLLPVLAEMSYVNIMSDFRPADSHFHRPRGDPAHIKAVKVVPRATSLVRNFEALEYCARHMFVGKAMPWPKAVAAIVPGSANLVPLLEKQGMTDMRKKVTQLTLDDWIKIADAFEEWPFRPETLMDSFGTDDER
ncbi:hypothetical protein JCM10212_005596 [Sporobolomyces blumeae]